MLKVKLAAVSAAVQNYGGSAVQLQSFDLQNAVNNNNNNNSDLLTFR